MAAVPPAGVAVLLPHLLLPWDQAGHTLSYNLMILFMVQWPPSCTMNQFTPLDTKFDGHPDNLAVFLTSV